MKGRIGKGREGKKVGRGGHEEGTGMGRQGKGRAKGKGRGEGRRRALLVFGPFRRPWSF